jgi:hypothetical protein
LDKNETSDAPDRTDAMAKSRLDHNRSGRSVLATDPVATTQGD